MIELENQVNIKVGTLEHSGCPSESKFVGANQLQNKDMSLDKDTRTIRFQRDMKFLSNSWLNMTGQDPNDYPKESNADFQLIKSRSKKKGQRKSSQ